MKRCNKVWHFLKADFVLSVPLFINKYSETAEITFLIRTVVLHG